jgi:general L-amino acid transport system substrate-binding protein
MINALASIAVGLTVSLLATAASAQATLASVKQKGVLTCGSNRVPGPRLRRAGCTG